MENTLFVCECHDMQHQFVVSHDSDPGWNEWIYVHVHLTQKSFWKRLKYGIAYVFGRRSCFGAFDEVMLDKAASERLRDALTKHINTME